MAISFSAPPAQPELNSSSPFYSTLQSYVLFGQSAGLPRDIVHNAIPRRFSGAFGTCFGEDPKVVSGAFPFAAAADGSSNGYSLRFTGGSKALAFPFGGFNADSGHGTVGVASTLFCVFKVEELTSYQAGVSFLVSSGYSPFTNQGKPLNPTYAGSNQGLYNSLLVAAAPNGSVFFGFSEDNGFQQPVFPCLQAPIVKGDWYLGAVSFYNGTDTFSGSFTQPRRVYLENLTTGTRICGTADTTAQTWSGQYWSFGPVPNVGFSAENLPVSDMDLIIAQGPHPGLGYGPFIGQIHLAGCDQQFWDNSGQFAAIPAAFSGTDPFTTLLNDIYGPARGTYATGSGGTTLVNAANQDLSDGNVISPQGQTKVAGAYTTIANAVAGVPSDLGLMFIGDCAVTKITNTTIEITSSRPQAGTAAVTSYSLHASTTAPFTPGSGNLIATQTISGNPLAYVFEYTPPDGALRFFTVQASDGTHTYTYPQVQAARRAAPAVFAISCGNSYGDPGAGSPMAHVARAGQALGVDVPVIVLNFDGSVVSDWLVSTAEKDTPFNTSLNPLQWLEAMLATEAAALGRPIDVVFAWLVENNTGTSPSVFATAMQTMASALVGSNLARFSPVPYGSRALAGNGSANPPGGSGEAIGLNLPTIDNGTTLVVVGSKWLNESSNFAFDFTAAHPSAVLAQIEGSILMNDYVSRFVFPPASGGGGVQIPSFGGGFR